MDMKNFLETFNEIKNEGFDITYAARNTKSIKVILHEDDEEALCDLREKFKDFKNVRIEMSKNFERGNEIRIGNFFISKGPYNYNLKFLNEYNTKVRIGYFSSPYQLIGAMKDELIDNAFESSKSANELVAKLENILSEFSKMEKEIIETLKASFEIEPQKE